MENLHATKDIMEYISNMNQDNSVCQFRIPGKGKFALVLQEEEQITISEEVDRNPQLGEMIAESRE